MKSLSSFLLRWLGGVLLLLGLLPALGDPTLNDFGYGNMTTKRSIRMAVILVNFTNDTADTLPYMMGTTPVNTNNAAAEQYYSEWFYSRNPGIETCNNYFHEVSNGRFQWLSAGVYMIRLNATNAHARVGDRVGKDNVDFEYMKMMVEKAMAQGFNPANHDYDGNHSVSPQECTIQLLTNDETFGGGARSLNMTIRAATPQNPVPITYNGYVAILRFNMGLRVVNEELIHVLQNSVCGDVYGPSGMSSGFTTMSGGNILHVDAWHKMHLAWSEPRLVSMTQPGTITLPAAQLMITNAPVVLFDTNDTKRGVREFFILEYRTTNTQSRGPGYDKDVKDSGLVIWHAQQNDLNRPIDYTSYYFPQAQQGWEKCDRCQSLFYDTNTICPATTTNKHVVIDIHTCMPCDDPSAEGVPGWKNCLRCGQLYYQPNANLGVCVGGLKHVPGPCDYRIRQDDDPEALGQRDWLHCGKCQCLFHRWNNTRRVYTDGLCAAGGKHVQASGSPSYTLLWWDPFPAMMTEGSPNLWRSRGDAWHSGNITPPLRWFDGTSSKSRLVVHPFAPNADQITVEIQYANDIWVDFAYRGTEDGTFDKPYNTFAEGVNAVNPSGKLHIKSGTSTETRQVNKTMSIEAYGGPAVIGQR